MKLALAVAGVACMSFVLGSTAWAGEHVQTWYVGSGHYRIVQDGKIVIFTQTTNSRIPERVQLRGQQVNTASPMFVVQGNELNRTGATSIIGMIAMDPSVSTSHRGM